MIVLFLIIAMTRMKIKKERIIAIYLQFFDFSLHPSFLGLQMLGPMAKCRSNGKGDGPRVEDGARIGQANLTMRSSQGERVGWHLCLAATVVICRGFTATGAIAAAARAAALPARSAPLTTTAVLSWAAAIAASVAGLTARAALGARVA